MEPIGPGAVILRGFASGQAATLLEGVAGIAAQAPFRHMLTPGGRRLSAAMTNSGSAGWVSDRRGYRYEALDPHSGQPWPALPEPFLALAAAAAAAAGWAGYRPDGCLVNRYEPGARMGLHQDRDEAELSWPIVSVSLGLPVVFLFGGDRRTAPVRRARLAHGDVVVWGGESRLAFHGVAPLAPGAHPLTGACRINLTLRRARAG
jgi:alkylated DNA repair protein (DNA oxidative demethylase)